MRVQHNIMPYSLIICKYYFSESQAACIFIQDKQYEKNLMGRLMHVLLLRKTMWDRGAFRRQINQIA